MKTADSLLERIVQRLAKHYAHALLLNHIREMAPEAANSTPCENTRDSLRSWRSVR